MGESNSRKRRRHDSVIDNSKTVKAIFKKDDLDDSMSVSDWGLTIDDSPKRKRTGQSVRFREEPLNLICQWSACGDVFSNYDDFNGHLKEHIDECTDCGDSIPCSWTECGYAATSVTDLNQHLCYHGYHLKLMSIGKNVEIRENLPECNQKEKFTIPVVPCYKCEWQHCKEYCMTIYEFFNHVRVHIFHNPRGAKEGVVECSWKGCIHKNQFPTQYKLREHVRIHTKEKIIACPACGHLFANRTKFCDHRRRQIPENMQSFLCSQCSKYFPSERLLRDHMRLHINHYKCSMCDMTCPKPSILAKHFRYRHLNARPYKCDQCDYRCVSKHNLDVHLKKHQQKNPYECNECNYSCRSAFGLERHYQKNHDKDWNTYYECHVCKKRFLRGGLLTRHLMKVHNYHWPSGHSRFRYKEDQDGVYRLQMVRYETLDVTEEIIKGRNTRVQQPSGKDKLKFKLVDTTPDDENSIQKFDIVISKEVESEQSSQGKKVVITIDDLDAKGNVLKSQTIQSDEIVCTDLNEIAESEILVLSKE